MKETAFTMAIKNDSRTVKHLTRNPLMQWQRLVDVNIESMLSTNNCNIRKTVAHYSGMESPTDNPNLQNTLYHERGTHFEQTLSTPKTDFALSKTSPPDPLHNDFTNTFDDDDIHKVNILDVEFGDNYLTGKVDLTAEDMDHTDNDMDKQPGNLYSLKEWNQVRDLNVGNGSPSSLKFYDDTENLFLEEDEQNTEETVVRDAYINKDEFERKLTRMCESSNNEETVSCYATFAFANNFDNSMLSTTGLHCLASKGQADIAPVECIRSECFGDDRCNMPPEVEQRVISPPYSRRTEWTQICNRFGLPQLDENSPQSLHADFPDRYEEQYISVEVFSSSHDDSSDFSGNEGDGSSYRDMPTRLVSGYDLVSVDSSIAFSQMQECKLAETNNYRNDQSTFTRSTSSLQPARMCPCSVCSGSEETKQIDTKDGADSDDLGKEVDNAEIEPQHDIFSAETVQTAVLEFKMIETTNPNISSILLNNDETIVVSLDSKRKTIYKVPQSNERENYLKTLSETVDHIPIPEMIGNFESSPPYKYGNQCDHNCMMCTTRHKTNNAENRSYKRKEREDVGDLHSPKNSLLKERQKSQDRKVFNLCKTGHYTCSSSTEQNDRLMNSTDDAKFANDKRNAMGASLSFGIQKNGDENDLTRNSSIAKPIHTNFHSCSNNEKGTGRSREEEHETYRGLALLSSQDIDETYRFKSNTGKAHNEKKYRYDNKTDSGDNKRIHSLRQVYRNFQPKAPVDTDLNVEGDTHLIVEESKPSSVTLQNNELGLWRDMELEHSFRRLDFSSSTDAFNHMAESPSSHNSENLTTICEINPHRQLNPRQSVTSDRSSLWRRLLDTSSETLSSGKVNIRSEGHSKCRDKKLCSVVPGQSQLFYKTGEDGKSSDSQKTMNFPAALGLLQCFETMTKNKTEAFHINDTEEFSELQETSGKSVVEIRSEDYSSEGANISKIVGDRHVQKQSTIENSNSRYTHLSTDGPKENACISIQDSDTDISSQKIHHAHTTQSLPIVDAKTYSESFDNYSPHIPLSFQLSIKAVHCKTTKIDRQLGDQILHRALKRCLKVGKYCVSRTLIFKNCSSKFTHRSRDWMRRFRISELPQTFALRDKCPLLVKAKRGSNASPKINMLDSNESCEKPCPAKYENMLNSALLYDGSNHDDEIVYMLQSERPVCTLIEEFKENRAQTISDISCTDDNDLELENDTFWSFLASVKLDQETDFQRRSHNIISNVSIQLFYSTLLTSEILSIQSHQDNHSKVSELQTEVNNKEQSNKMWENSHVHNDMIEFAQAQDYLPHSITKRELPQDTLNDNWVSCMEHRKLTRNPLTQWQQVVNANIESLASFRTHQKYSVNASPLCECRDIITEYDGAINGNGASYSLQEPHSGKITVTVNNDKNVLAVEKPPRLENAKQNVNMRYDTKLERSKNNGTNIASPDCSLRSAHSRDETVASRALLGSDDDRYRTRSSSNSIKMPATWTGELESAFLYTPGVPHFSSNDSSFSANEIGADEETVDFSTAVRKTDSESKIFLSNSRSASTELESATGMAIYPLQSHENRHAAVSKILHKVVHLSEQSISPDQVGEECKIYQSHKDHGDLITRHDIESELGQTDPYNKDKVACQETLVQLDPEGQRQLMSNAITEIKESCDTQSIHEGVEIRNQDQMKNDIKAVSCLDIADATEERYEIPLTECKICHICKTDSNESICRIFHSDTDNTLYQTDKRQILEKDRDNKIICETGKGKIFPLDDIQHERESGACDAKNMSEPGTIVPVRSPLYLGTNSDERQIAKIDAINEEFKLYQTSVKNEAGQIIQAHTSNHTFNNFELNMDINSQHVSFDNPKQKVNHSEAYTDMGSFLIKSFSSTDGNNPAVLDLGGASISDYRTTRSDTSLKILTENYTETQGVGSDITANCFINTWDQGIIMSGDTVSTDLSDDTVYLEEALTTSNNPPWICTQVSQSQESVSESTFGSLRETSVDHSYSDNAIEKKEEAKRSQKGVSSVSYWTRFCDWLASKLGYPSKKNQNTNMFMCSPVSKSLHLKSESQSQIFQEVSTLETSTTAFLVVDQQALLQVAETRSTDTTNGDRPIASCGYHFSPDPSPQSCTCDTRNTNNWILSPDVTDGTWQHTKRRENKQLFKDVNCQTDIDFMITNARDDSHPMRRQPYHQLRKIRKLTQKQKTRYPKQSKSLKCIKCSNHVKTRKTKGVSGIYLDKADKTRKNERKRNFSLVKSGNDGSSVENIDCSMIPTGSQREMEQTVYGIPDSGDGIVPTSLNCCDSKTPGGKEYTYYQHSDCFCEISLSSDESINSLSTENKRVNKFLKQSTDKLTGSKNRVLNEPFKEQGPSRKSHEFTETIVISYEPLTFSTVEVALQPTYSEVIPEEIFSSDLDTKDSNAKGAAQKYNKITRAEEAELTAFTNKSDDSLAEADVATRQCDTNTPDMQRLSETDILQFSLECLLEMLVQRGKVLQAFVANTEGCILAKTGGLVITDEDSRKILGSLSSSYTGAVRLQLFNEIYTCLKHEDGTSLVGRSQKAILVARQGQRSMVVGFADPSTPGSCIREIQELSRVLSQRGL